MAVVGETSWIGRAGPDEFAVRRAGVEDRATIFAVHVDSVTTMCGTHYTRQQVDGWFEGRSSQDYTRAIERGALWITELDGEAVGITEVFPGKVTMMFVRGAWTGRGIGAGLLGFALELAAPGPDVTVTLEATLNAQAFYERHGFRKTGDGVLRRASGLHLPIVLMERPPA